MRNRNPLMKPVAGKTALATVTRQIGSYPPYVLFILFDVSKFDVKGVLEVFTVGPRERVGLGAGTVYNSHALRGYGPLLYDMSAWAVNEMGLAPGLSSDPIQRSRHSDRLWARYLSETSPTARDADGQRRADFWKSPSTQSFKRKYGTTPRNILSLGQEAMQETGLSPAQWIELADDFEFSQPEEE